MVSDSELGKREEEREHLALFLNAYKAATGESFPELYDSETPDFIGFDVAGRTVGIEITQLSFAQDEQHMRRISPQAATTAMRFGACWICSTKRTKS